MKRKTGWLERRPDCPHQNGNEKFTTSEPEYKKLSTSIENIDNVDNPCGGGVPVFRISIILNKYVSPYASN